MKRKKTRRYRPHIRRQDLIEVAIQLACGGHYLKVTRDSIAALVGCTRGLVSHYLGKADQMRDTIVIAALQQENLAVIAQALSAKHWAVAALPEGLRVRARESL